MKYDEAGVWREVEIVQLLLEFERILEVGVLLFDNRLKGVVEPFA